MNLSLDFFGELLFEILPSLLGEGLQLLIFDKNTQDVLLSEPWLEEVIVVREGLGILVETVPVVNHDSLVLFLFAVGKHSLSQDHV